MLQIKKILVVLLFGLCFCFMADAQSDRNYIMRHTMLDSAGSKKITSITYYDGLGRAEETVTVGASPSGADLVQFNSRDRAGRIIRQYNATPSFSNGSFVSEQDIISAATGVYGDAKPYSLTQYEQSPLGRKIVEYGPGEDWHSAGKAVKTEYFTNSTVDAEFKCRLFSVTDTRLINDMSVTVTPKGLYPDCSLYVTKVTDEDGRYRLTFVDKQGRQVLTRSVSGKIFSDTYYVYDIAGYLTAVLPPALSAKLGNTPIISTTEDAKNYAYFYIRDWYGRCRAKKLPGREWQVNVYDKSGKAVMTQDGNMRENGEAIFSITDAFGRDCVKGIMPASLSVSNANLSVVILAERNAETDSLGGYIIKNGTYNFPSYNLLKVNYYDNYDFLSSKTFGSELSYRNVAGFDKRFVSEEYPALSAQGMFTGSATRILNDTIMLYKSVYYDYHGNVIQEHKQNAMGGFDHYYYRLTFTGKPLTVRHEHITDKDSSIYEYNYTYDNMERLLTVSLSRNGESPTMLARYSYNDTGHPQQLSLGESENGIVEYGYNVRGWTSQIANKHFSQILHYADVFGNATPCYNGNVSAMEWTAKDALTAQNPAQQSYTFTYDGFDRLEKAKYSRAEGDVGGLIMKNKPTCDCSYTYDRNGNPTGIYRSGVYDAVTTDEKTYWTYGDIDDVLINYNGNQIKNAINLISPLTYTDAMTFKDNADEETEYTYDANGNMTSDLNKGIYNITYNILNLPQVINYGKRHLAFYTYDADGNKLKVEHKLLPVSFLKENDNTPDSRATIIRPPKVITISKMQYSSGHIYRNNKLQQVNNDYGYWADSTYHYYIKDYQGNVRAVIAQDGTLEEINNYYPYGSLMGEASPGVQPFKYGAKELDRQNGINIYDSQARFYDPIICRTTTQDPLAEKYYSTSPYLWCAGNPMKFTDPDGNAWKIISEIQKDGSLQYLGFEWITPELSYNKDGSLKEGLYEQAIVFTDNGTYDAKSGKNIGSSTAIVHKIDGSTEMFDASTMPSDPEKFATIPSGLYHATVGKHQGKYDALRLYDTNNNRRISLDGKNPKHPDRDYAEGINIHKAGLNNFTGITRKGTGVSEGCFLIDINKWTDFINLFINSPHKSVVGVILQRQ